MEVTSLPVRDVAISFKIVFNVLNKRNRYAVMEAAWSLSGRSGAPSLLPRW